MLVLWACWTGVVLGVAASTTTAEGEAVWRPVVVDLPWFNPAVTQEWFNLSHMPCGMKCLREDWCSLWCHEAPRKCLLTSLRTSPSYTPQPGDARSCYTSHHAPELAAGANISSSPHYYASTLHSEQLVDGIYGYRDVNCGLVIGGNGGYAWFLLDLWAAYPISEVVLWASHRTDYASLYFRTFEVRVGSVPKVGDFSTYQLLGKYIGPAVAYEIAVLRPAVPIIGRYVSIQATAPHYFLICHLEIR